LGCGGTCCQERRHRPGGSAQGQIAAVEGMKLHLAKRIVVGLFRGTRFSSELHFQRDSIHHLYSWTSQDSNLDFLWIPLIT
jgi:hypothetical protein